MSALVVRPVASAWSRHRTPAARSCHLATSNPVIAGGDTWTVPNRVDTVSTSNWWASGMFRYRNPRVLRRPLVAPNPANSMSWVSSYPGSGMLWMTAADFPPIMRVGEACPAATIRATARERR